MAAKVLPHRPPKCPGCARLSANSKAAWNSRWQVCSYCVTWVRRVLLRLEHDPHYLDHYAAAVAVKEARLGWYYGKTRFIKKLSNST